MDGQDQGEVVSFSRASNTPQDSTVMKQPCHLSK